jgi:hypothetical protein
MKEEYQQKMRAKIRQIKLRALYILRNGSESYSKEEVRDDHYKTVMAEWETFGKDENGRYDNPETVRRSACYWQNTEGIYKPSVGAIEKKTQLEKVYRGEFSGRRTEMRL